MLFESVLQYDASPDLRRVIAGLVTDDEQFQIARYGLSLKSRAMRFDSPAEMQRFQGTEIMPKLTRVQDGLQRLDLQPEVTWRTIETKSGNQISLIYFKPETSVALRGIYRRYVEIKQADPVVQHRYDTDANQQMLSGSLAYMVPSRRLSIADQDGKIEAEEAEAIVGARMKARRQFGRAVFYADSPQTFNRPLPHR
jgi:hypothetical protein